MKTVSVWSCSGLEAPFFAWSRSRPNLVRAGADPIWSEPKPESAPGPRTSGAGAAQKSGCSATLTTRAPHLTLDHRTSPVLANK